MNVLKIGLALAAAMVVTGCATVNSASSVVMNNHDKSGIIYGMAGSQEGFVSAHDVCKAINNKDSRCANLENYVVVKVFSKVGFADGAVGTIALVEKDFPYLNKLNFTGRTGDKNAPYVKAKISPGKLGEVLEIVSIDGDGKCQWSGMPRIGGVVCPAYNWDYRKDNQAAIVLN